MSSSSLKKSWHPGRGVRDMLGCCMLAIPQHLDIAALLRTPSSSPFAFALQSSKYMLVVPNRYTSVYTRLWCGYEAYLAFQSNKVIRTATPPVLRQVLCAWFRMLPALLIGIVVGFGDQNGSISKRAEASNLVGRIR